MEHFACKCLTRRKFWKSLCIVVTCGHMYFLLRMHNFLAISYCTSAVNSKASTVSFVKFAWARKLSELIACTQAEFKFL